MQASSGSPGGREEIAGDDGEVGVEIVGHVHGAAHLGRGHVAADVDVAQLRDAQAFERGRQAAHRQVHAVHLVMQSLEGEAVAPAANGMAPATAETVCTNRRRARSTGGAEDCATYFARVSSVGFASGGAAAGPREDAARARASRSPRPVARRGNANSALEIHRPDSAVTAEMRQWRWLRQAEIEDENQESERRKPGRLRPGRRFGSRALDAARQAPYADEPIVLRKKNERQHRQDDE